MYIEGFPGYSALIISFILIISIYLKAYYHFKIFKITNNVDITFFEFYINPIGHFFTKLYVYFPFILFKSTSHKDVRLQDLRKRVVIFSWINLICCLTLATIVLTNSDN